MISQKKFNRLRNAFLFRRADLEAWKIICRTANEANFKFTHVSKEADLIGRLHQNFIWEPTFTTQSYSNQPYNMIHHVVHFLCFRYGNFKTFNMPKSTLYFEALACGIDAYYSASIVQMYGIKEVKEKLTKVYPFGNFVRTSKQYSKPINNYWQLLSKEDPFDLYRSVVSEVDMIYSKVTEVVDWFNTGKGNAKLFSVLKSEISELPYVQFSTYFNNFQQVLFAQYHADPKLKKRDLEMKAKCKDLLNISTSFADFLSNLSERRNF
jgi:hypothetical protein